MRVQYVSQPRARGEGQVHHRPLVTASTFVVGGRRHEHTVHTEQFAGQHRPFRQRGGHVVLQRLQQFAVIGHGARRIGELHVHVVVQVATPRRHSAIGRPWPLQAQRWAIRPHRRTELGHLREPQRFHRGRGHRHPRPCVEATPELAMRLQRRRRVGVHLVEQRRRSRHGFAGCSVAQRRHRYHERPAIGVAVQPPRCSCCTAIGNRVTRRSRRAFVGPLRQWMTSEQCRRVWREARLATHPALPRDRVAAPLQLHLRHRALAAHQHGIVRRQHGDHAATEFGVHLHRRIGEIVASGPHGTEPAQQHPARRQASGRHDVEPRHRDRPRRRPRVRPTIQRSEELVERSERRRVAAAIPVARMVDGQHQRLAITPHDCAHSTVPERHTIHPSHRRRVFPSVTPQQCLRVLRVHQAGHDGHSSGLRSPPTSDPGSAPPNHTCWSNARNGESMGPTRVPSAT